MECELKKAKSLFYFCIFVVGLHFWQCECHGTAKCHLTYLLRLEQRVQATSSFQWLSAALQTSTGNGLADAADDVGPRNNGLAVISCCFPAGLEDRVYLK